MYLLDIPFCSPITSGYIVDGPTLDGPTPPLPPALLVNPASLAEDLALENPASLEEMEADLEVVAASLENRDPAPPMMTLPAMTTPGLVARTITGMDL